MVSILYSTQTSDGLAVPSFRHVSPFRWLIYEALFFTISENLTCSIVMDTVNCYIP